MSRALNPWDTQSERIWTSDGAWHSLSANTGGGSRETASCCGSEKTGSLKTGGNQACYAIHENGSQEIRLLYETAYPLTVGGGKPGQSYPAVLYRRTRK